MRRDLSRTISVVIAFVVCGSAFALAAVLLTRDRPGECEDMRPPQTVEFGTTVPARSKKSCLTGQPNTGAVLVGGLLGGAAGASVVGILRSPRRRVRAGADDETSRKVLETTNEQRSNE